MKVQKVLSVVIIGSFVFFNFSCNPFFDRQQAKKTVLNEDPSFTDVLQEKDKIDGQIKKAREVLKAKKKEMDIAVGKLKRDYAKEDKKISLEIKNLENELDTHKAQIKLTVTSLSQELKTKKVILKNTESTMKQANNLLSEDSQAQLSSEETTKWKDKLQELNNQKQEIMREIEVLKEKIAIEKLKLKLLN